MNRDENNPAARTVQPSWTKTVWLALLILAMTLVVYWPAMRGGFIWDDNDHISENKTLHSAHGLREIWFKPGATCQYYPLSFTGFWAGYQIWGLNPLGYHLLNIAMHAAVAILLWQLLMRLNVRGAWLAGAIFALHPVCVMSVAWMTELKNTLSASLALGAGWAYLRFAGIGVYEQPNKAGRKRWLFYVLSLMLFQLALFAKTAVSFLPVSLLLITWWKRDRLRGRDVWPFVPMLGLVAGMGWLTFHIEHLHGAVGQQFNMGFWERAQVSGQSFWFYLGKLFFPRSLTFIYERWHPDIHAGWQFLFPLATVVALFLLWWKRRSIGKGLFAGFVHFYVCTSFLILLVVLYMTRYSFVSDHWQYFGCMSVFAVTAAGITAGLERLGGTRAFLKPGLCGALLLLLGALTWRQCGMYSDIETLWRTTISRNPHSFLAHNNLAFLLAQRGEMDEAMKHFQEALKEEPNFAEAHYNFANALLQQSRIDEAMAHFQKALEIQPDYPEAHNNLGNALLELGAVDEAMAHFESALKLQPDFAEAHFSMGNVLLQKARVDDAIAHFKAALEARPDFAQAHNNLGHALILKKRTDEAIAHFQAALAIEPGFVNAHYNLGHLFLQTGRANEAIVHFQKVVEIAPDDAEAHGSLSSLFFHSGRTNEAVTEAGRALELAEAQSRTTLADTLRAQLKLYQAGSQ